MWRGRGSLVVFKTVSSSLLEFPKSGQLMGLGFGSPLVQHGVVLFSHSGLGRSLLILQ